LREIVNPALMPARRNQYTQLKVPMLRSPVVVTFANIAERLLFLQ